MEQLGLNINFAVYEDWLLLNMGKEDLLVQLINRMNGDSIHLWEKKSVKYALNEIPVEFDKLIMWILAKCSPFLK